MPAPEGALLNLISCATGHRADESIKMKLVGCNDLHKAEENCRVR